MMNRSASLAIQKAFLKPYLLSIDIHLVFSIYKGAHAISAQFVVNLNHGTDSVFCQQTIQNTR